LTSPVVSRTIFDCAIDISSTYSRVLTNVIRIFFDLKKLQPRKIQKYGGKKISVSGGVGTGINGTQLDPFFAQNLMEILKLCLIFLSK